MLLDEQVKTRGYVWPFGAFIVVLALYQLFGELLEWDHPDASWWRRAPEQWVYPLQVLICGGILVRYWRQYDFAWGRTVWLGALAGLVGIGVWLTPTMLFDRLGYVTDAEVPMWLAKLGVAARTDGFDPGEVFNEGGGAWWTALLLRFLRAVVIVALVEEIFWRGFLMRYLLNPDGNYWSEPFGRGHWKSFVVVTLAFMLIHNPVDWAAAFFYGSLAYGVTVWTKSLGAVVVMHAVANLLMGWFAVRYGKLGLW